METKMCIQCSCEKDIELFFRLTQNKPKLICRKCYNQVKDKTYATDPELMAKRKIIRDANRLKIKEKTIENYKYELAQNITEKEIIQEYKICKKCHVEKTLSDFHFDKSSRDGHVNACKKCINEATHIRLIELGKDPVYREKERLRAKERYRNLNPIDRHMKNSVYRYDNSFMVKNEVRNAHTLFSVPKGYQCHHWNYNKGYELDVIILAFRDHRKVHNSIKIIRDSLIFETKSGELLDTKEKHEAFINDLLK